jgi:hypothetical protein
LLLPNQGLPQVLHDRLASRFVPPAFADTVLRRYVRSANATHDHSLPDGAIAESKVTPSRPKMQITDAARCIERVSRVATSSGVISHICNTGRDTVSHIWAAMFTERAATPRQAAVAYRLRPECV